MNMHDIRPERVQFHPELNESPYKNKQPREHAARDIRFDPLHGIHFRDGGILNVFDDTHNSAHILQG
ncbi:hypothetical protein D1872_268380 [compost metagenome]